MRPHAPRLGNRAAVALTAMIALGAGGARAHVALEEVTRVLDSELTQRPEDSEVHLRRAQAHEMAREWAAALAELDAAARRGADFAVVGTLRGRVLLEAGRAQAARAAFDRVLRRDPTAFGTWFDRGRAWLALGKPRRAADDFGRAIAGLASPRPEHVMTRRDALVSIGRRAAAVRALDDGMARIGRVAVLELAAIDLEEELGHYDDALRRLAGLLVATPQNPAWVARRGTLLDRARRPAEARSAYADALALIDARPAARRGVRVAALRQQLVTALAVPGGTR